MIYAVKSDRGVVRQENEDSYNIIAGYPGAPAAFIIADGMGGHRSGEVASRLAVDFVSNYIIEHSELFSKHENIISTLQDMIKKANADIFMHSIMNEENLGMGTTLIVAVVSNRKLYIGHVGDSRVYLIRKNAIKQLTTDHSYIEELIKTGSLTREEASNHPKKNVITRALGCFHEVQVDTYTCDMEVDDYIVMCTDGLTNKLDEDEIMEVIEKTGEPELACEELVNTANKKGGEDNITVIIIKVVD